MDGSSKKEPETTAFLKFMESLSARTPEEVSAADWRDRQALEAMNIGAKEGGRDY